MTDTQMKLSIHTSITDPDYWQYTWKASLDSFLALADEVVVICGSQKDVDLIKQAYPKREQIGRIVTAIMPWPYVFSWEEISKHNNLGYSLCTGDWAMKADMDYVFHQNDIGEIRHHLDTFDKDGWAAMSVIKFTILNQYKAYRKTQLPFFLNKKKLGDSVGYGIATDRETAWGYPVMRRSMNKNGLPEGVSLQDNMVRESGIDCWNYDCFFKTREKVAEHTYRFSQARKAAGFKQEWGDSIEEGLEFSLCK